MSLASGTRLGSYEIIGAIGAGGMGEVYRARDAKLHRDVAIKVLPELFAADPDRLARFEREAQALAALNHPNIAQVFGQLDLPRQGGSHTVGLAMELVEGEDLSQRLTRGVIPLDEAVPIARQIADALEAAHERGIVHRDLKPANIKIREDGTVKVLDFGLAKLAVEPGVHIRQGSGGQVSRPSSGPSDHLRQGSGGQEDGPYQPTTSPTFTSPAMTGMGVILGTAAYMAPEQARGKAVDKRADIWAFGVVLYEMLSGVRPFGGETMTDALSAIVSREPDWKALPADARTAVGPLLRRCLEKDPRKRLQAIGEARIALEAPLPPPQAEPVRRAGMSTRIVAALVVAALGLGALAGWTLTRRPQAPQSQARPARLSIPIAPADTLAGGFALSPDGSQLAFVGQVAGRNQLFIRRLDHDQATAVPGSDGATIVGPSFSPDGRWLVFTSTGALKKAPVDGGPVTILGRGIAGVNSRSSWGVDGTIVFSNPMRGLSMIAAGGGEAEVLTTPDTKAGELTHEMPWFLPDGKTLLFSVRHANTAGSRIDALTLGTRQRRQLFSGLVLGLVGDDQLIVGREDTVMSVPFDTTRLTARGDATPLLDGTLRAARVIFSVFPLFAVARNGTIVFVPSRLGEGSRELVAVDRSGTSARIPAPVHIYSDPRVSPDGGKIAVHVFEDGRDNWILDLRSGAFTRLTFDVGEDETPVWSPDGKSVFWTGTRGKINRAIYQRSSDGSGAERLVWSGDPHIHIGGVSPDGSKLLISVIEGEHVHLAAVGVADGKLTPLLTTPFANDTPTLSPDGRWLAYTSNESGQTEVYVQPFPSMQGRTQVSAGGGSEPVWARNGRELYYRGRGKIMAVNVTAGERFSAAAPRPIFDDRITNPQGAGHTGYDVTPDGRFVFVAGAPTNDASLTHLQVIYRP